MSLKNFAHVEGHLSIFHTPVKLAPVNCLSHGYQLIDGLTKISQG